MLKPSTGYTQVRRSSIFSLSSTFCEYTFVESGHRNPDSPILEEKGPIDSISGHRTLLHVPAGGPATRRHPASVSPPETCSRWETLTATDMTYTYRRKYAGHDHTHAPQIRSYIRMQTGVRVRLCTFTLNDTDTCTHEYMYIYVYILIHVHALMCILKSQPQKKNEKFVYRFQKDNEMFIFERQYVLIRKKKSRRPYQ